MFLYFRCYCSCSYHSFPVVAVSSCCSVVLGVFPWSGHSFDLPPTHPLLHHVPLNTWNSSGTLQQLVVQVVSQVLQIFGDTKQPGHCFFQVVLLSVPWKKLVPRFCLLSSGNGGILKWSFQNSVMVSCILDVTQSTTGK